MKYKLVVSDFDGTLLKDDLTVSQRSIDSIKKYIALGGNFIVCTGRMVQSLDKWVKILGLDKEKIATIGFQGALVSDSQGNILHHQTIDYLEAYDIIKLSEDLGVYSHIYDDKNLYVARPEPVNIEYCEITDIEMKVVGKLSDFILKNKFSPTKMMWVIQPKDTEKYETLMKDRLKTSHCFMSSDTYLEFIAKDSSKGNAIKVACDILGIDLDDCIALGDQMNDLSMINTAGVGIAMANSRQEVLDKADYVTKSNNEDGVALVLEKIIEDCENGKN